MACEGSCGAGEGSEGVVQVVHAVAHTHQQPGTCKGRPPCSLVTYARQVNDATKLDGAMLL